MLFVGEAAVAHRVGKGAGGTGHRATFGKEILDELRAAMTAVQAEEIMQHQHLAIALRAGADGFLLKDTPPTEIVNAVRLVAAGEAMLSPSVTRTLLSSCTSRTTVCSKVSPGSTKPASACCATVGVAGIAASRPAARKNVIVRRICSP